MADQSSYKQIIKATSIFGGVQVIKAITGIISSKFIAILLGPTGLGIYGLYNTTIGLINSLTNFGIGTSAVKTIASIDNEKDNIKLSTYVAVIKRITWITGLIGLLFTLIFSRKISYLTFGNYNYSISFSILSVTLLFNQLSIGQISILQGLRKHNYLANAIITGAIAGVIISLPLYYFLGINGLVPSILLSSALNLLRSWYFSSKINIKKVSISRKNFFLMGSDIVKMGIVINLSGIITTAVSYITRVYIGKIGGIEQVGLYNAGFLLINGYVGLIFSAMATDYFPRLSACTNKDLLRKTINEQAEILLLLLSPIILIFFIFNDIIIIALYSKAFLEIKIMLFLSLIGMIFRAASWSISFIYVARGDTKIFFWNELIANFYFLLLNVILYNFFKISGLGLSFLIGYILYFFQQLIIMKKKYDIQLFKNTNKIIFNQLFFVVISFISIQLFKSTYKIIVLLIILILNLIYSYYELNKRINIRHLINKILFNKNL